MDQFDIFGRKRKRFPHHCLVVGTIPSGFHETAIGMAIAEGAAVEQFRGDAAEKLKSTGGIGAFLR